MINSEKKNIEEQSNTQIHHIILYDRILLWLSLSLSSIGLVMVMSSSIPVGQSLYHDPFFFVKEKCFIFF